MGDWRWARGSLQPRRSLDSLRVLPAREADFHQLRAREPVGVFRCDRERHDIAQAFQCVAAPQYQLERAADAKGMDQEQPRDLRAEVTLTGVVLEQAPIGRVHQSGFD